MTRRHRYYVRSTTREPVPPWDDYKTAVLYLGRRGVGIYYPSLDCWSYVTATPSSALALAKEGQAVIGISRQRYVEETGWRGVLLVALDSLGMQRMCMRLFGDRWSRELNLTPPTVTGGYVLEEGP